jgi:hypothetical protein
MNKIIEKVKNKGIHNLSVIEKNESMISRRHVLIDVLVEMLSPYLGSLDGLFIPFNSVIVLITYFFFIYLMFWLLVCQIMSTGLVNHIR